VTAIPLTFVRSQAGLPFVFTIDSGKIIRRQVVLGLHSEEQNLVEVREGLVVGERVLTARIDTLKPGSPVVVTADAADTVASDKR